MSDAYIGGSSFWFSLEDSQGGRASGWGGGGKTWSSKTFRVAFIIIKSLPVLSLSYYAVEPV